jgi:hypothetical protein
VIILALLVKKCCSDEPSELDKHLNSGIEQDW